MPVCQLVTPSTGLSGTIAPQEITRDHRADELTLDLVATYAPTGACASEAFGAQGWTAPRDIGLAGSEPSGLAGSQTGVQGWTMHCPISCLSIADGNVC
jgi:hypothetical protein